MSFLHLACKTPVHLSVVTIVEMQVVFHIKIKMILLCQISKASATIWLPFIRLTAQAIQYVFRANFLTLSNKQT
jgi:hypothetical protein